MGVSVIRIDTLSVDLDPSEAASVVAAIAAGRFEALTPAVVAALRRHPALLGRIPADAEIVISEIHGSVPR
ncbi:hypothetical protein J5X84_24280 [Streptosporangiaceae bacterium NEAU-GS5]|nr:hypothetical protein [Streptosporangiaceae bacterium NEAU-GS5]